MEIQINKKGVKWSIMEFKCASCKSRFTEWGKKKGKFGGSINCLFFFILVRNNPINEQ